MVRERNCASSILSLSQSPLRSCGYATRRRFRFVTTRISGPILMRCRAAITSRINHSSKLYRFALAGGVAADHRLFSNPNECEETSIDQIVPTGFNDYERTQMAKIKYVCLSDMHLGAENSLLTKLTTDCADTEPIKPSPALVQLVECLKSLISQNDNGEKPTLILNGDILELALT